MCCSGPERRGRGRNAVHVDETFFIITRDLMQLHEVVVHLHVKKILAFVASNEAQNRSFLVILFCIFVVSVLLLHHATSDVFPVIFAHVAYLLVWPGCVSSCTPVSVPLFA